MSVTVTRTPILECKHCNRTSRSSQDVARLEGWRMFKGKSVTGKDLDDVVCPRCAGTATEPEPVAEYTVGCHTCDWNSDEDDNDEPIVESVDAIFAAEEHRCEPDVYIKDREGRTFRQRGRELVPA